MLWMMKRYNFSLREMAGELRFRPGALKIVGPDWYPAKSWPHKWPGRLPPGMLDELILLTVGEDAFGTLSVDSSRHRFNRYVLADDTKRGKKWVHDTIKHHALISPGGKVASSAATGGAAGDFPMLAKLCAKTPRGHSYLLGDGAYCSEDNCDLAVSLGRSPCFEPKSNHLDKGMNPWAEMARRRREHPGRFYRVYGRRNTIESCFGAIKGRFAYCVRSVTFGMQRRELASVNLPQHLRMRGQQIGPSPGTAWGRGRTVRQIRIARACFCRCARGRSTLPRKAPPGMVRGGFCGPFFGGELGQLHSLLRRP